MVKLKRKKIIADFITPISIFTLFKKNKYSFLLESAEKGKMGRYSFIGFSPLKVYKLFTDRVEVLRRENGDYMPDEFIQTSDPLSVLEKIQQKYHIDEYSGIPPFCGGLVGYVHYEIIQTWENIKFNNADNFSTPLGVFIFADEIIAFDHLHKTVEVIKLITNGETEKLEEERVNKIVASISGQLPLMRELPLESKLKINFKSNFTKKKFKLGVENIKEEILKGEIIQGVFSQRLETDLRGEPFNYYRALRVINPSPYMFYLKLDDIILCGSSPEVLVKVVGDTAMVRPIAGTRPRSENDDEEKRLITELKSDVKEKAEHIMLVDLGRNDLSRVCEYGSVKVDGLMEVEKYSHVMHMVTNVKGKIRTGVSNTKIFKACFPAGTVSGAPKIRAIEIIRDQENLLRGPYAGSVGYFSFTGDMDMCITIRTMIIKDRRIYMQAGAGIVADSVPESEYHETLNKAKALFEAVRLGESSEEEK